MYNIKLIRYQSDHYSFLSYKLSDDQRKFTYELDYLLNVRGDIHDPEKTIISITYGFLPIGFFVLDVGEDKYRITDNNNSILFRSFSLNPEWQSLGFAFKALELLDAFILNEFSSINEIVLSVNVENEKAIRLYQKIGFIENQKILFSKKGKLKTMTKKVQKSKS